MRFIVKECQNTFDIIMPVFNGAAYIADAIRSCLYQNYSKLNLIIVDDGSTDSTKKVVQYFTDPRIKYYYKENGGPASAMNYGIEHSNGDAVCFAAHDDIQLPDRLEVLNTTFQQKIDFCYSGYNHSNKYAQPWEYVPPKPLTAENIKNNTCMSGGSVALRRYVFDKIKFRDLPFNEDMGLSVDLYLSKLKYAMIDMPLFNYRLLLNGLSASKKKEVEKITAKLSEEL